MKTKGIILAAGKGTRLIPATIPASKPLLPLYDKPMVYYPLSVLMLAQIKDILIITRKEDLKSFKSLLGNGKNLGINITYAIQKKPKGIADAFIIGKKFIGNSKCALILGDNIFYGENFRTKLQNAKFRNEGATIFSYSVHDPNRYGVVELDKNKKAKKIIEKPKHPKSNLAVTGLYFYDNEVVNIAKKLKPSKRGELEITDLNMSYLDDGLLNVERMNRGMAWLDTGTFDSLFEASSYIYTLEKRQGLKIGCPDEAAWRQNWISNEQLEYLSTENSKNEHGKYLNELLKEKN